MKLDFGTREFLGEAVVYQTESASDPGLFHYTLRLRSGDIVCTCPGWRYTQNCKHVKDFSLDSRGSAILNDWTPLSNNQAHVLTVLATWGPRAARDTEFWPLNYNQVRGITRRLRLQGLVDTAGFRHSAYVWVITDNGRDALRAHNASIFPPAPQGGPSWQ